MVVPVAVLLILLPAKQVAMDGSNQGATTNRHPTEPAVRMVDFGMGMARWCAAMVGEGRVMGSGCGLVRSFANR
jgi:hypothetical protein